MSFIGMIGGTAAAQSSKRRYNVCSTNKVSCFGTAIKDECGGVCGYTSFTYLSTSVFNTSAPQTVDVMLVGGGGTGSQRGGGAGGNIMISDQFCLPAGCYTVTVGEGGGPAPGYSGWDNGSPSTFFCITASGGGAGAHSLGNGGGAGAPGGAAGTGTLDTWPACVPSCGIRAGGTPGGATGGPAKGGSGGGATLNGSPTHNKCGYLVCGFEHTNYYYGGGGGGAQGSPTGPQAHPGGLGGGGAGTQASPGSPGSAGTGGRNVSAGQNGAANTGGGAGGGNDSGPPGTPGGTGGSGIVVIRVVHGA